MFKTAARLLAGAWLLSAGLAIAAPVVSQLGIDPTGTSRNLYVWDSADWVSIGSVNTSSHAWSIAAPTTGTLGGVFSSSATGGKVATGVDTSGNVVYSAPFTLTTAGSSGAATFSSGTLNIPQYSGGGGSGTVTSVGLSAPSVFSVSGSPVTTSGTLALSYSGTALPIANGGTGNTTGLAASATKLATARAINGVNFDGTAAITVPAAAGTLTGSSLASGVTGSSLTSVGTIGTGVWQGTAIADSYISSAATWNSKLSNITGLVTEGSGVSITGSGTSGSPYTIAVTGTGGVSGPGSSVIGNIATWNATDGSAITDSGIAASALVTASSTTSFTNKNMTGSGNTFPTFNQNTTGNAATATKLATAVTINGVSFDGSTNVTVPAAAGTLTGSSLASGVTGSSLTSVGTIGTGTWQGSAIADSYISSAATWNAKLSNITGLITEGANITITGSGTSGSPYSIAASGGGGGGVSSVGLSAPGLFTVSGSPVTSSGTLALTYSGTALPIANGGTAATSAGAALTSLGAAASGSNGDITTLSALTTVSSSPTFSSNLTVTGSTTLNGPLILSVTAPTSSTLTLTSSSGHFECLTPSSGGVAVTLSASTAGTTWFIKDCKGTAGTSNDTITPSSGKIDGATSYTLNANYQGISVTYDGTNYWIN